MKLLQIALLIPTTLAAIFQKKAAFTRSDSTKVFREEHAPSLLSCAQLCKRRNSELYFKNGLCKCFVEVKDGKSNIDEGLDDGKGIIYQQAVIKDAPNTVYHCNIKVLSIAHNNDNNGMYFLFRKGVPKELKPRAEGGQYSFNARNSRTHVEGKLAVWGYDPAYPNYDGHGRFNPAKTGQFQVGDEVIILDKQFCSLEIVY